MSVTNNKVTNCDTKLINLKYLLTYRERDRDCWLREYVEDYFRLLQNCLSYICIRLVVARGCVHRVELSIKFCQVTLLDIPTRYVDANFDPNMSVDVNNCLHSARPHLTVGIA